MKIKDVSIIIPVFNQQFVKETIESLLKQNYLGKKEIIFIYDNPKVAITSEFRKYLKNKSIILIEHKENKGLAGNYNEGIKISKYPLLLFIHEDCVAENNRLIVALVKKINSKENIYVVNASFIIPRKIWNKYGFWDKMVMLKYIGKISPGGLGKGTLFKRELFKKIGLFNSAIYRTAGEDMDFEERMSKEGIHENHVNDLLYHNHRASKPNFFSLMKKEGQMGEAHGAFKRNHRFFRRLGLFDFEFRIFFILITLLGIILSNIPLILLGISPFIFGSIFGTIVYYRRTRWLPLLFTYPILGIIILLDQTFFAIKGFIKGKQGS